MKNKTANTNIQIHSIIIMFIVAIAILTACETEKEQTVEQVKETKDLTANKKKGTLDQRSTAEHRLDSLLEELKGTKKEIQNHEEITSVTIESKAHSIDNYDEYLDLKMTITNNSERDIRAIKGIIRIKSLFGDHLVDFIFEYTEPLPAGESTEYVAGYMINRYKKSDRRLVGAELKDLKIKWIPEEYIFAEKDQ